MKILINVYKLVRAIFAAAVWFCVRSVRTHIGGCPLFRVGNILILQYLIGCDWTETQPCLQAFQCYLGSDTVHSALSYMSGWC